VAFTNDFEELGDSVTDAVSEGVTDTVGVTDAVCDMDSVDDGVTLLEPVWVREKDTVRDPVGVEDTEAPVDRDAVGDGLSLGVTDGVPVAETVGVRDCVAVREPDGERDLVRDCVDVDVADTVLVTLALSEAVRVTEGEGDTDDVADTLLVTLREGDELNEGDPVWLAVTDGVEVTEVEGVEERLPVPVTLDVLVVDLVGVTLAVGDTEPVEDSEMLGVTLDVADTLGVRVVDGVELKLIVEVTDGVRVPVGLKVGVLVRDAVREGDGETDGVREGELDADFVSTYSTYTHDNTLPSNNGSPAADTTFSITKRQLPKYSLLLGAVTVITPTSLQFDVVNVTLSSTLSRGHPYPLFLSFIKLVTTLNGTNGAEIKLTLYVADWPSTRIKYCGSIDTPLSGYSQLPATQSLQLNMW
jgi:hypothetical protein